MRFHIISGLVSLTVAKTHRKCGENEPKSLLEAVKFGRCLSKMTKSSAVREMLALRMKKFDDELENEILEFEDPENESAIEDAEMEDAENEARLEAEIEAENVRENVSENARENERGNQREESSEEKYLKLVNGSGNFGNRFGNRHHESREFMKKRMARRHESINSRYGPNNAEEIPKNWNPYMDSPIYSQTSKRAESDFQRRDILNGWGL